MVMKFTPDYQSQNGIFKYIVDKYQKDNSSYISVFAQPTAGYYIYSIVDDSQPERYLSSLTSDIYIHLSDYKVKLSHISFNYNKKYYIKDYTIYDFTNGINKKIANIKNKICGTELICSKTGIDVDEVQYDQLIDSLLIKCGQRSDGTTEVEFKSFEIYGSLYSTFNTRKIEKTVKSHIFIFVILLCYINKH